MNISKIFYPYSTNTVKKMDLNCHVPEVTIMHHCIFSQGHNLHCHLFKVLNSEFLDL